MPRLKTAESSSFLTHGSHTFGKKNMSVFQFETLPPEGLDMFKALKLHMDNSSGHPVLT